MITDLQCAEAINLSEAIGVVGKAFQSIDTSTVAKTYIDCPNKSSTNGGGDFRAMPARIGDVAGVKWVSVFPKNSHYDLPTVIATIILNSSITGELLAILEATHITKLRTAAAAAVATKLLSNPDSKIAAFIGCGAQTQLHVEAICKVRDIKELRFFDLNYEAAKLMSNLTDGVVSKSIEECVGGADIVTTLTPSSKPIVKSKWLKEGVHMNAMGADAEGKREFDSQTYKDVDIWVVDDFNQATHSGETQHAYISRGEKMASMPWKKESNKIICNLTECLGRTTRNQVTLFDSTGVAIQDIAVANYIYEKLKEQ